ncbi:MAG: hypothetical protein E6J19_12475 [Chloroflexi bacterium]|nr:MAG: hypothetical protein E6J19_12475 [Chloroflexota bacterium]
MSELGEPDRLLRGHFDRAQERRYVHIPFDVPRGVRQLHVAYEYNDRIPADPLVTGGNTLDIGLFDEGGIDEGSPGFRGWSGSEKLEFTIDEQWATPPYAPGPIGAGKWHVLVGPYKVAPRGCDWVPRARGGWIRGDLHCHTVYSDGDSLPRDVLVAAGAAGLEFLGVTDHNSVRHQLAYGTGGDGLPIVLPGIEVTTYGGHWNAWGTDRWWEFRAPDASAVARTMRAAAEAGAVISVNHPKPFGPAWDYGDITGFHAVEIWNGPWPRLNTVALAFWEERLRRGERIAAVGGSDTHQLKTPDPDARHSPRIGAPTTWVEAGPRPTVAAILAAIREGRAFVSASPRGPQLYLDPDGAGRACVEARGATGCALLLISEAGVVDASTIDADAASRSIAIPAGTHYVRAQLVDRTGDVRALTNALWAERL